MRKLLSLPPNAVKDYHGLHERSREEWFWTSDPREKRLGSGSGTTWLLEECYREEQPKMGFLEWLQSGKRVLRSDKGLYAGLQAAGRRWRGLPLHGGQRSLLSALSLGLVLAISYQRSALLEGCCERIGFYHIIQN